jgi:hypothetical protein
MIKEAAVGLLVSCCAAMCLGAGAGVKAQKKAPPDLSGVWKLDKSKGNYAKYSGLKPDADLILVVSHAEPEIKVVRRSIWAGQERVQEAVYYSDGRGETSRTFMGSAEHKSKSEWDGDRLVTRFSYPSKGPGRGTFTYEVTQEWKLSADGETLTQTERVRQTGTPLTTRPGSGPIPGVTNLVFPEKVTRVFRRIS